MWDFYKKFGGLVGMDKHIYAFFVDKNMDGDIILSG